MEQNKKILTYDLNPRFFKDTTGNGKGDIQGVISKFDYFTFLGIDTLILQGIISTNSNEVEQSFTRMANDIGGFKELNELVKKAKQKGIKIFIEIKIGSIKEKNVWFDKAVEDARSSDDNIINFSTDKDKLSTEVKYSKEAEAYFSYDEKTNEIPLNWNSKITHKKFVDVVRFWHQKGIDGFVFTDFEYINNLSKSSLMNEETLMELRKLYVSIKEINDGITIIGKSSIVDFKDSIEYTKGSKKVFDFFKSSKISLLGIHSKYGADVKGKFSPSKLFKVIKTLGNNSSNIIQFGSEIIGRYHSRWEQER